MIETERLILRRWTPEDREGFAQMATDPEVMQWLGGTLDRAGAQARIDNIEATFDHLGYGRYALVRREDGVFLGWCGVMPAHPSQPIAGTPEIGWRLIRSAWGSGYATEAAKAALTDAFERASLPEVWAYTVAANLRSQAVMDRLGLTRRPDLDFINTEATDRDPHRLVWVARP